MVSALFVMILFSLSVDYEIEEGSQDGSSGDTKEKDLAPSASPYISDSDKNECRYQASDNQDDLNCVLYLRRH